jgi:diadenosine tetraphosphate (Ap4A) HIT family hydrolase
MRIVDKHEALALLALEARRLLADETACLMCALVESAASERLAQSEHGVVLLDRFASRPGHLLVVARRHVERGTDLGWPTYAELQRLAWEATQAIERVLAPKRVFVAALGASTPLPMSFPHYHVHVIPVYEDDERARPAAVLSWTSGVVIYEDAEARQMCMTLRAAWPRETVSTLDLQYGLALDRQLR